MYDNRGLKELRDELSVVMIYGEKAKLGQNDVEGKFCGRSIMCDLRQMLQPLILVN